VPKKEYNDKILSDELEQIIASRNLYARRDPSERLPVIADGRSHFVSCAMPIITEGDIIGCVASVVDASGAHTAEPATELPTAPGTYTLVVDFTSIRNGTYPMEEYMGFLAYSGKDGAPVTVYLSLEIPEEETTAVGTEGESESVTEADSETEGA
jgi:hypothetical protein